MNDIEHACNLKDSAPSRGQKRDQADQVDSCHDDLDSVGHVARPADRPNDSVKQVREIGGRKGPDPVRYGDWEKKGRCIDF